MKQQVNEAEHYRLRSEQARAIANDIFDRKERKTLREIASEYDEMARKAEVK